MCGLWAQPYRNDTKGLIKFIARMPSGQDWSSNYKKESKNWNRPETNNVDKFDGKIIPVKLFHHNIVILKKLFSSASK